MNEKCMKDRFVFRTILVIFTVLAFFVFAGTVLGEHNDGTDDHQKSKGDCDKIKDDSHVGNSKIHDVKDDGNENETDGENDDCHRPPAPTPELSTSILMSAGLIGLIGFSRLNKK